MSLFTSPHLQELERRHAAALANASELRGKASAENRALTQQENDLIGSYTSMAKRVEAEIAQFRANNTLAQMVHEQGPSFLLDFGKPKPRETGDCNNFSGRKGTLREAMQYATAEQLDELKNFARYLGGDMSALADLTPGGDAGVLIPTLVAGVVERNYAAFAPVISVCRVWQTLTGEPEKFPVVSDSESATILAPAASTGADATVSGDTPPTSLGGPTMNAYKFSSKPV